MFSTAFISKSSLLYNRGKTDGLPHTLGHFLRKVHGVENGRFRDTGALPAGKPR